MLDFNAKRHQIQFRLGLCSRPRSGSLQRPPGRRIHQGQGGCGCPDPQNFHGGGRVRVLRVILAKSCDESAFSIHSSCRLRHCKWGIYVKWSKLAFYFKISDRVLGILPCQILSELRQIFTIFILQHYAKRYIIAWMQTWTRFPPKTPIYPPFLLITHFYPRIASCRL